MELLALRSVVDDSVRHLALDGQRWADPEVGRGEAKAEHLWAVPGLVDAHAHLSASTVDEQRGLDPQSAMANARANAWAQVEAGVFLVFDKGSRDRSTLAILDEPPDHRPELTMAGSIMAPRGGYFPDFGPEVGVDDLTAAIAAEAEAPAEWIKLVGDWPRKGQGPVTNYDEDALALAVDVAHAAGCRVAIHTNAPVTAGLAVRAGVDSIEHGLFLESSDLERLGRRGGAWVPTIAAMEAVRDMLGADSSGGKLFATGLANVRELLGGARSAGVTVLAGSDLHLPHGGVAAEAARLAEYGMDPLDVLWALTDAGRDYLGKPSPWQPGQPANAVFFDADPRQDPSVLSRPTAVLFRGRWLKPLS